MSNIDKSSSNGQRSRTQKNKKSNKQKKKRINSIKNNLESGQFFCYDHCKRPPVDTDEKHRKFCFRFKKDFFFYFSLVALIAMNYFYLSFVASILIDKISFNVIVISQVLFALNLLYFFAAAFSDPGIYPRATEAEANAIQFDFGKLTRIIFY